MRRASARVRKVALATTPSRRHYTNRCTAVSIILCLTIEPGVCLPEFGVRLEMNIHIRDYDAVITGERQDEIVYIRP